MYEEKKKKTKKKKGALQTALDENGPLICVSLPLSKTVRIRGAMGAAVGEWVRHLIHELVYCRTAPLPPHFVVLVGPRAIKEQKLAGLVLVERVECCSHRNGLQNAMTSSRGRTSAEAEGSRLPPRENADVVLRSPP